jgi:hypothetical protein
LAQTPIFALSFLCNSIHQYDARGRRIGALDAGFAGCGGEGGSGFSLREAGRNDLGVGQGAEGEEECGGASLHPEGLWGAARVEDLPEKGVTNHWVYDT